MKESYKTLDLIVKSIKKSVSIAGLIGLLNCGANTYAQIPRFEWEKTYGGKYRDFAISILHTSDQGYVFVGKTIIDTDNRQLYLAKTNINGRLIWETSIGGEDRDYGYSVKETKDGEYIIAGETRSFGAGNFDGWLIKTNSNGKVIWHKTYGGRYYDYVVDVEHAIDDGYVLVEKARSFNKNSSFDAWLIKTDIEGNILWQKTFGGNLHDYFENIKQTSDGGYIMTGTTESFPEGNWNIYVIKTDKEGNLLWEKAIGSEGVEGSSSVLEIDDGYVIAGAISPPGPRNVDAYLVKIDPLGKFIWEKSFGGLYEDSFSRILQANNGYILVGETRSIGDDDSDAYLVKTDFDGNFKWEKIFGGVNDDGLFDVKKSNDSCILAGYTGSFGEGDWDAYLVKLCPDNPLNFIRGDANSDGKIDISDSICTLAWLFSGGEDVANKDAADTNDDGIIDISDAIQTLNFLFLGGDNPKIPYPNSGVDPTLDDLGCS